MVYLEIENVDQLIAFVTEAKKEGLLKDISLAEVRHTFNKKTFPIRVPIELNAILGLCKNSIVKKIIGGKFETLTRKAMKYVEAGC